MLENALDYGLSEFDFWDMTISEVNRYVQSRIRVLNIKQKQKANFDYTLANLIGRNISIVLGGKEKLPPIEEVYPNIFAEEKKELDAKMEEQNAVLEEQKARMEEQKARMEEQKASLRAAVLALSKSGMAAEMIAKTLHIEEEKIKEILS